VAGDTGHVLHTAAVLRHLASLGLVTYLEDGADAFLERAPDEVAESVSCVAQPGREPLAYDSYDEPDFQIIVRGEARAAGQRAADIRNALHGIRARKLAAGTPDEVYVVKIISKYGAPIQLGMDEAGLFRYSVSFRMELENATPLRRV